MTQRNELLKLLQKFEQFLYGTVGTWKTYPAELQLKEDAKPIFSQPYPVQNVHEEIFKKEVDSLVLLGSLKVANDPEWGAPYFAQTKPESNRVCFISDFRNLNKQLNRKSHPMQKINYMLLKLEVFSMLFNLKKQIIALYYTGLMLYILAGGQVYPAPPCMP